MRTLLPTLLDYDPDLLVILAQRWDVDLDELDRRVASETLAAAMLDPDRAAGEWGRLGDTERGALQTLHGAPEHRMAEAQFARLFGEIRQMGPGRREREKPHLQPANVSEVLFYRGLLARGYAQGKAALEPVIYIPTDLAAVLPVHTTGFDLTAEETVPWSSTSDVQPETTTPATTTLVDDLTTLLAYCQVVQVPAGAAAQKIQEALAEHLLGGATTGRAHLLVALARGLGLVVSEDDALKLVPAQAKTWLEQSRPRQVRSLAEAWRALTLYNELWLVPTLQPEDTGWQNDPLLARQTVLTFLEVAPGGAWWPLNDLVDLVHSEEPDFQRPGGDYESWYIRDLSSGEYVRGFENWDRVDGAVLRFILTGPLHWLGLVDLGDGGTLCRLTAYGRALVGEMDWPDPPDDRAPAELADDGTLRAPRTLSRYERFQVARITEWETTGDPYTYRLTAASLRRAGQQAIRPDLIQQFLRRVTGADVPEPVRQMLARWDRAGEANAWLTHAVILRTAEAETLDTIFDTPQLRRYLGARLGPTAVMVRAGQQDDLAAALQHNGILVDFHD